MNRSLTVFTLSFMTGIILVTNGLGFWMMSGLVLVLLMFALLVSLKFKRLFVFLMAAGVVFGSLCTAAKDLSYLRLKEGNIPLCRGVVLAAEDKEWYVSTTVYLYEYRQKVKLTVEGDKKFKVNDLLEIKNMTVSNADDAMNDGAFNYRMYLKSIGINYAAKAKSENVRIYGRGGFPVFKQAREINLKLNERIKTVFGKNDIAGVVGGIFVGNKSLISKETYDYMKMAGISHIMSVSGLHIMTIVAACYFFCNSFGIRGKKKNFLIVSVLVAFALITGMSSSVIRASFMVILVFVALSRFRDNDSITSLSLAALVLSVFNPYVIYNTGFQMSFLATLSIVITVNNLTKIPGKLLPKALTSSIALSLAAQMGIFPVMIYANGYITTLTLFANLICVPLLPFIYLFGSVSLITGANPFTFVTRLLVNVIIFVSKKVALFEFNKAYFPGGTLLVLCSIGMSLSFMYAFSRKKRRNKGLAFLLAWTVVFGACTWYNSRVPGDFTVTFINVGHGDCTLVRSPDGSNMLIDTATEDMADSQVIPYLNRQGIRNLECIVLSHFDDDHAGGFERIVRNFGVKAVIVPYASGGEEIKEICNKNEIDLRVVSRGNSFKFCGAEFEVLSPKKVFADNSNDSSIIMKMVYNKSVWLFTGDASLEMFENIYDLKADIFKVSHHGDKKCIHRGIVMEIDPIVSVISAHGVGDNGADEETLELLSEFGRVFTTYEDKTISFICDKNGGIYFGKNKEPIKVRKP